MPQYPESPNGKNHDEWSRVTDQREHEGLTLLLQHYRSSISALASKPEQMRQLVLALAYDHVPYFHTKTKKAKKWDILVSARLLRDVQAQLQKGRTLQAAVMEVGKRLPKGFGHLDRKSLEKRYRIARKAFAGLVDTREDGSLIPKGESQGRIWNSFLVGSGAAVKNVRFGPDPYDPTAELVSGLTCDNTNPTNAED